MNCYESMYKKTVASGSEMHSERSEATESPHPQNLNATEVLTGLLASMAEDITISGAELIFRQEGVDPSQ